MGEVKRSSEDVAGSMEGLGPEQAYSVGAAVGELLKKGISGDQAADVTAKIADFIRRGAAAQRAIDEILAAEKLKHR